MMKANAEDYCIREFFKRQEKKLSKEVCAIMAEDNEQRQVELFPMKNSIDLRNTGLCRLVAVRYPLPVDAANPCNIRKKAV